MGRYDSLIAETIAIQNARQAEIDYDNEIYDLAQEYKELAEVLGLNEKTCKYLLKYIIDRELSEVQLKDIYDSL